MKVLVAGYRGFIGPVLVPLLLDAGHEVVGLDTRYNASCDLAGGASEVPTLLRGLRGGRQADLAGVDAVVPLAALSVDPLGDFDPEWTHQLHHRTTARRAAQAREAGVSRFHFSSSRGNYHYGASGDGLADEASAAFNPGTFRWSA